MDFAFQLAEYKHLKIIVPGGIFRKNSFSLVGTLATENFKMFRADKYFVSANGITREGVFTSNIEEGQMGNLFLPMQKKQFLLSIRASFAA